MTSRMPSAPSNTPRIALVLGAALLTLAACNRDKDESVPAQPIEAPAPAITAADAAAPFAFDSANTYANVKLTLPQAVKPWPDLHARLYSTAVRDLRQFTEGAQADKTEAGGQSVAPYEKQITFDSPVETGKIISLARRDYEFTGGAHGNTLFAGVLWDKAMKRQISAAQMFRPGADMAALDRALCVAVNVARKERNPEATPLALTGGDWSCPKAADTPFVLSQGTTPGKAGGLTFLIGPYQVGPYSDGSYAVAVPQSAIRAQLAPAYADEFAGEPVKPASNPANP
ncbi:PdaC/SigV domain-containing protein [Brevundimonas sp.]|uniref:PdaC/SigV domain-containing protein n=1 Tax=Brevundimonas sp. TaxID=1871086 RepID=UPI003BAD62A6